MLYHVFSSPSSKIFLSVMTKACLYADACMFYTSVFFFFFFFFFFVSLFAFHIYRLSVSLGFPFRVDPVLIPTMYNPFHFL